MSDKSELYKNIENFIDNDCAYKQNSPFIATFHKENEKSDILPRILDYPNFIQCIMNLPKEKESLLKENENEFKVNITNSSFEFVLYTSNNYQNVIKCLLLLIVNDMEKVETKDEIKEENQEKDKPLSDINNEYKLLEKLKKFIFNYIKKNKKKKNHENNVDILETILLAGAQNGIRYFNIEQNGINLEDPNIQQVSEIIKSISSKLEIKKKKNDTEKKEKQESEEKGEQKGKKENENDINQVLDELNPDYKNELIYKYLDEMPLEIANLMKKYRKITFTKDMYNQYLESKNKNTSIPQQDKMNIDN